jgi:osmotically-inducible protein OsmY
MKKKSIFISCLLVLTFFVAFAAYAETAGEFIDDSVITTKVKALLAEDDFVKSFQIGVETHEGTVQLSGFVDSQAVADKAGQITQSVGGVKSIKNDLIVK